MEALLLLHSLGSEGNNLKVNNVTRSSIRKTTVTIAIGGIVLLLLGAASMLYGKGQGNSAKWLSAVANAQEQDMWLEEGKYSDYIHRYIGKEQPKRTIKLGAEQVTASEGAQILSNFEQADGQVIQTDENGYVSWEIDVPESGLYNMSMKYYPVAGNSAAIERELRINGKTPFVEAKKLTFTRVWENKGPIERANRGNDLRPSQIESPQWQEAIFKDRDSSYSKPYQFYFEKGLNQVQLMSVREPLVIAYVQLHQEDVPPSYAELEEQYRLKQYTPVKDAQVKIQGEDARYKSDPTLYPIMDRTSPTTEPYHPSKIRLNTIGGMNWNTAGQWMEWEVEVPQEGLYELVFKYRQNLLRGLNVSRRLTIDGAVPFKEAENLSFGYDANWQMGVLGQEEKPFLLYFTKGKHSIKMEVTLGELSETVPYVESSILGLNQIYQKIVMVTGAVPDPYRDYHLEKLIPDLSEQFRSQSERLNEVLDRLEKIAKGGSDNAAVIKTVAYQLNDLADHPESIIKRLEQFKANSGALGTWLLQMKSQPLEIDYMLLSSADAELPEVSPSLPQSLKHHVLSFMGSFVEDYSNVGNVDEQTGALEVWINEGRDQAQILKTMIESDFTAKTNIHVNLRVVDPAVLLSATLAGRGPDIALNEVNAVDLAMRNALEDLSQYPGFDEVSKRFRESAFTPFQFENGIYALPEKQIYPMMFYRKDILQELGLKVPQTWEDLYAIIPVLKKKHLDLAMTPNVIMEMLLFQNGGQYYRDGGKATDLDSEIGVQAFSKWTELYTNYKLPQAFDFNNRFRLGEMPIGIADYTAYNQLMVFAPEIRGLWDFAPVPGMKGENGQIHRETGASTAGAIMFRKTANKLDAWEFMKWWTSKESQLTFGREMESLMGASARYPTANLEALQELPWSSEDYVKLEEQGNWVQGIPNVPGGYFTARHLNNAFFEVLLSGSDPRETIEEYANTINMEIAIKRKEFNLPTE